METRRARTTEHLNKLRNQLKYSTKDKESAGHIPDHPQTATYDPVKEAHATYMWDLKVLIEIRQI